MAKQRRDARGRLLTSAGWPSRGRGDEKVVIRYFVIPNTGRDGGFLPMYEQNGRLHGEWRGMDRDAAEARAIAMAHEAASKYVGDWTVRVAPAPEKYIAGALKRDERHWAKVRSR